MKHVVITGANRGIGLELARHYQAEGCLLYTSPSPRDRS